MTATQPVASIDAAADVPATVDDGNNNTNQNHTPLPTKMATVPRDARLAQGEKETSSERRQSDDLFALRSSTATLSPGGARARTTSEAQRLVSFTTDDLPSTTKPLLAQTANFSQRILTTGRQTLKSGLSTINSENVAKLGAQIVDKGSLLVEKGALMVDKVKQTFTEDESERILKQEWIIVETEDEELDALKTVILNLEKAFQFSKSSPLVTLATTTLKRCESLVDRSSVHAEHCQLMFSQCSNEIATLQDYLGKLREAIQPVAVPREKNEDKRVARRAEWAVSRMVQSSQSMVTEMRESLDELDDLITECTRLMVEAITLLHIRTRSADFSGTGVAVGAASVVAGALVGAAGVIAAPVTGGLSVPISIAGKGLFFSGVAALTPSTIMLNRHSQQLEGLVKLVEHLKSRLEIMTQKREEMSKAFAACEDLELNVKQAGSFCQDALELEISPYDSVWPFVEPIYSKLATVNGSVTLFLSTPSLWHYCKQEDALHHYLLPEEEDE